jgi:CBS domain-containing protein
VARLEFLEVPDIRRYTAGKVDWAASALPVEGEQAAQLILPIVRPDVPRCGPADLVGDVREEARRAGWRLAAVVDDAGVVLGLLSGGAFEAERDELVAHVMDPAPPTVRPSLLLDAAAERLGSAADSLLVTTSDGILLGLVTRAAVERQLSTAASRSG